MKTKYVEIDEEKLLKPIAKKIAKDLYKTTINAIDSFYAHYTPKYYERTYELYKGFKGEIGKINNGYEVRFEYSQEWMKEQSHNDNYAAYESFLRGYHGGPTSWRGKEFFKGQKPPRMLPMPWTRITQYVDELNMGLKYTKFKNLEGVKINGQYRRY